MDYIFNSIMSSLHAIKLWMPNLFDLFTHSEMAIGLAGGMILVGILIFLYLLVVFYIPAKAKLEQLIDDVKNINDTLDMSAKINDIDRMMNTALVTRYSWNSWKKYFIFADKNQAIHTTTPASEFFNIDTMEEGGVSIKSYSHVADSFVGIGLVFTFLGLVSGIYFAAKGLSGDAEQAKQGLVQLLDAATFKFMTSIAGVGIAVLFTIGYNKIIHKLEIAFIELSTLLEERIIVKTIDATLLQQQIELSKQTELLTKLLNKK